MSKELLKELQELKFIMSKVVGSSDGSPENRFSEETLNKAEREFKEMSIERGDWVKDDDIKKYIKSVPWNVGAFIRKEFEFSNWFKRGHEYLYSKKDLIALDEELTGRNIDLKRYKEFVEDKAAFDKRMATLTNKKSKKSFHLPVGIKDIPTSDIAKPDPEIVRTDLARLKQEFKIGKLEGYIDVYKGTHAMLKNIYYYQKYLEPGLKRRCRKWCDDFNYANHALELITGKKEKFKVEDSTGIQL
jgi:hypothetical protein